MRFFVIFAKVKKTDLKTTKYLIICTGLLN